MKAENINKTLPQLRVLVAPLDWGLGHATRCIPIIKHLISNGAEVILAAEGACRKLLSAEFPALRMLELRGYRVKYQQKKKSFTLQILRQIPNLFKTVRYENKWLEEIVTKEKIQVVISDNRYGLYNANAYTIFITHQLRIKSGSNFIDNFLQRINYNYIKRFNECWVPDEEKAPGLAHGLSHPKKLPAIPVKYMGILSRFEKHEMAEAKFHWLLL
ncbi:MAG: glycosyl transferase family 28, partial [Chitinophagaceae bacterium]